MNFFLFHVTLQVHNNISNKQNKHCIARAYFSIRIIYLRLIIIEIFAAIKGKNNLFSPSLCIFVGLTCLLLCFKSTENP